MKKVLITALLFLTVALSARGADLPKLKTIPFAELGPAASLPLRMTVPDEYVWVKKFVDLAGVVVLCASSDESSISAGGDFSRATKAVISLRQSANDFYDTSSKAFSFEKSIESEISQAGGKNLNIEKRDIKGLPVAVVTFEIGSRKLYSAAIAQGQMVYRLSYNARSQSRDHDDAVWAALVSGL